MNEAFDFGLRIRELRESKNMSQEMLGKIIGRSKPVISSYENNIKTPPLDVLIKLSGALNVSIDYLVGIEKKNELNTNGLSSSQIELLVMIADELRNNSRTSRSLSVKQQNILSRIINEFCFNNQKEH